MKTAILIILCAVFAIFAIGAFFVMLNERRARKEAEKNASEGIKNNEQITIEANKTKADARTGDHKRDINFMADKLHDYANK